MEILTNKNQKAVVFEGNKFRVVYNGNKGSSWRCTIRKCKARLQMDDNGIILEDTVEHNHEQTVKDLQWIMLKSACKRKACEAIDTRPSKIMRKELASLDNTAELQNRDLNNCRAAIYRARRQKYPKLPKSAGESVDKMCSVPLATSRKEDFLMYSEMVTETHGMIIFTCKTNIQYLCDAETVLGDGTFYVTPPYFYQLYTLHGYIQGHYIPLVFCLLPNKTIASYEHMLNMIHEQCEAMGLSFRPTTALLDFEIAAHTAFRNALPETQIQCCRFHYGQAVFKKIREVGLYPAYKDPDNMTGRWLKSFFGLPFLRPDEVGDVYAFELMADIELGPAETTFADYMLDTYVDANSRFPPHLWSRSPEEDNMNPRTTNGAESFHRHLKGAFGHPHPNIFIFSSALLSFQEEVYIKLQSLTAARVVSRKQRERNDYVCDAFTQYDTGVLSRIQFVQRVAYKFLPVE